MVIRNQILSISYRAALGVFGLALYALSIRQRGVSCFFSYDLLLTLFVTILVLIEVLVNGISLRKGVHRLAAGLIPSLTFMALSLSLSHLFLAPILASFAGQAYFPTDRSLFDNLGNAILLPIFYFLDWALFGEKGTSRLFDVFFVPAFPFVYGVTTLLARQIGGKEGRSWIPALEPHVYEDGPVLRFFSENGGWNGVVLCLILVLLFHFLVAACLYLGSRFMAKKGLPTTD